MVLSFEFPWKCLCSKHAVKMWFVSCYCWLIVRHLSPSTYLFPVLCPGHLQFLCWFYSSFFFMPFNLFLIGDWFSFLRSYKILLPISCPPLKNFLCYSFKANQPPIVCLYAMQNSGFHSNVLWFLSIIIFPFFFLRFRFQVNPKILSHQPDKNIFSSFENRIIKGRTFFTLLSSGSNNTESRKQNPIRCFPMSAIHELPERSKPAIRFPLEKWIALGTLRLNSCVLSFVFLKGEYSLWEW